MSYIEGDDRSQGFLFPESLEDYVGSDNPVRFLDAFVNSLDLLELGFKHASTERSGRPPYDPGDLLKLYIYGYMNRHRSSRDLERQSYCNLEVIWLMRKLRPDFKTIADFRRDNAQALRKVCQQFIGLCRGLGLYGGKLVAIDGSKFKAVNSKDRNYSDKKLQQQISRIDHQIEEYLRQMDENDELEVDTPKLTAEELAQKIEELKRISEEKKKQREQLRKSGQSQVSATDPDSRLLRTSQGGQVGYNVQFAVDQEHKLIVAHQVTNSGTDLRELSNISRMAKENLEVESLDVVADKGYYSSEQIKICEDSGIQPYIAKPDRRNQRAGYFDHSQFSYNPASDTYLCPAGEALGFQFERKRDHLQIRYYATPGCKNCAIRAQCTPRKAGRLILRWREEAVIDRMRDRIRAHPEKLAARKSIIEHAFGTLKHAMNQGYFLMKGMSNVATEMSLSVLAYNIKRAINIKGTPALLLALT